MNAGVKRPLKPKLRFRSISLCTASSAKPVRWTAKPLFSKNVLMRTTSVEIGKDRRGHRYPFHINAHYFLTSIATAHTARAAKISPAVKCNVRRKGPFEYSGGAPVMLLRRKTNAAHKLSAKATRTPTERPPDTRIARITEVVTFLEARRYRCCS